jgi:multiple sugar transport system permease protein/N,N'-diacetylchitobiose transport system permease protein
MARILSFDEKAPLRKILTYGFALVVAIFSLLPLYWMIVSAFRAPTALFAEPSLIPGPFSLEYVDNLLKQTNYPRYYLNSLVVAILVTAVTLVVSVLMAYTLNRFKIKGMKVLVHSMLYAYMFPQLLLAIPLYTIFVRIHLDNTLISLIICHCTLTIPLGVWLLWGFFKTLSFEIEEAALVDGASRFGAFLTVTLPLAKPGIITVGIFSFILSWADYVYALIIVNSDDMKTVPLGLASMLGAFDIRWGEIMVGSVLISIPMLLIFIFFSKYFIKGLAAGALKE